MPVAMTHLKRDAGNLKDSFYNWVQLIGVNVLFVLSGRGTTDLCEDSTRFNRLVHHPFYQYTHYWGVFLLQPFEFME